MLLVYDKHIEPPLSIICDSLIKYNFDRWKINKYDCCLTLLRRSGRLGTLSVNKVPTYDDQERG